MSKASSTTSSTLQKAMDATRKRFFLSTGGFSVLGGPPEPPGPVKSSSTGTPKMPAICQRAAALGAASPRSHLDMSLSE